MILDHLKKKGLINPPNFILTNTVYLTVIGSHAYGVADTSVKNKIPDFDTYGCCIPPKEIIFPHLQERIICLNENGSWEGFGKKPKTFTEYQKHHVFDQDANSGKGKEYDLTIFNIVKFFQLCFKNVPNTIDSLFTRPEHVLHITHAGQIIKDNRHLFLSKLAWKTYRGYAISQLKKAGDKINSNEMKKIVKFEDDHDIPRKTTFKEVEIEIIKRGLKNVENPT